MHAVKYFMIPKGDRMFEHTRAMINEICLLCVVFAVQLARPFLCEVSEWQLHH